MADNEYQVTDNDKNLIINRIRQLTTDSSYNMAPFGADDKDIQIYTESEDQTWEKWGSLRNFFQEWLNFKKIWVYFTTESSFIYYGSNKPKSKNVCIWFETQEDTVTENSSSGTVTASEGSENTGGDSTGTNEENNETNGESIEG